MRAAWPRVSGRTAASFSRTSLERPPTARVVEVGGQAQVLVAAEGVDVGVLAIEIAGVGGVDLDLLAHVGAARPPICGQIARQVVEADRRG